MSIVSLNGHVFDLNEIVSTKTEKSSIFLTFRNGDRILLAWRDGQERHHILSAIGLAHEVPAQ